MTTLNALGGRHWTNDARTDASIVMRYVIFALRWLAGLESTASTGRHAERGARAPGWGELAAHYAVATVLWTRGADGDDESALSRVTRVVTSLVAVTALWLLVRW